MKEKATTHRVIFLFVVFLFAWTVTSLIPVLSPTSDPLIAQFLYIFVSVGIVLLFISSRLVKRMALRFDDSARAIPFRVGIFTYGAAVAAELAFFSSWFTIIDRNPETLVRIKHIMIALPLSVGLALVLYVLLPRAIEGAVRMRSMAALAGIILPSIGLGFVMFADYGFNDWKLFAVMSGIGAFIALGHYFSGKFYLTLTTLFLIIYSNTLAAERFAGFSWTMTLCGFIFCGAVLSYAWRRRNGGHRPVQAVCI